MSELVVVLVLLVVLVELVYSMPNTKCPMTRSECPNDAQQMTQMTRSE